MKQVLFELDLYLHNFKPLNYFHSNKETKKQSWTKQEWKTRMKNKNEKQENKFHP